MYATNIDYHINCGLCTSIYVGVLITMRYFYYMRVQRKKEADICLNIFGITEHKKNIYIYISFSNIPQRLR